MSKVKTRTRVIRKPDDYIQRVTSFLHEIDRLRKENRKIVCVDETGFDDKALPLRGQRLYVSNDRGSWSRISAAVAITSEGKTTMSFAKGSFRSATFAGFLEKLDAPRGTVILMDNVSFHKSAIVTQSLEQKGWTALFTPPYSPWYNPIENVFGVVRRKYQDIRVDDTLGAATTMMEQIQSAFDAVEKTQTIANCYGRFWKIVDDDLKTPPPYYTSKMT
jgi:hypothetical protein